MRLVLTGPMCAGKSHVGRALAERLQVPFTDLDRLAEQRIGGAIAPFFAREGEQAFRQLERDLLLDWLSGGGAGVLATGGGTLVEPGNMDAALREATVVLLSVGEEELVRRILRAGRDRPLYLGLDEAGVRQRTRALLLERGPHYARATVTVDAEAPVEEVVRRIVIAVGAAQES